MNIKKTKDGKYIVDEATLKDLLTGWTEWNAAECGGVDNWSYFGEHYDDYFQEEREKTGNGSYGVEDYVDEWIDGIEDAE